VEEDQVRKDFSKLDISKSMGPHGIQPQVLRELADVPTRSLSTFFEQSWQLGDVSED